MSLKDLIWKDLKEFEYYYEYRNYSLVNNLFSYIQLHLVTLYYNNNNKII